ncbi:MAG: DNA repair exonuclease [Nitrososphaerota archaeon]|nr:DNA repair exonuclease [Nitrososphaerota archaeon]
MNVRAIITADNHLDPPLNNFGLDRWKRKDDFLKCFEEMVDYARKEKPDILLMGGDLFDNMWPSNHVRAAAMKDFRALHEAGVKVFAVSGHHDTPKSRLEGTSPLAVYGNSGYIHYFRDPTSPETVSLDYRGFFVTVTGVGHNPLHELGNDPMDSVPKGLEGDFNIVIAHAPVQGFTGWTGDEPIIRPSAIPPQVNLLAVGHFHDHQEKRSGKTEIIYPGSTERVDAGEEEDEKKGFVWAELSKDGSVSTKFIPTSARKYETVELQFPNVPKPLEVIKGEVARSFDPQVILRVRLSGRVDPVNLSGYRRADVITFAQGKVFHCFVDEDIDAELPAEVNLGPRTTPLAELDAYFQRRIEEASDDRKAVLREALQVSRSKLQEAGAW